MNVNATNKGPTMNGRNRLAPPARRGLSLVEVMISLAISTFLLVAVAAAYNASADAVEMNDKFFRATQAGRVTMNQLLTEIRRADSVQVYSDYIDIIRPDASKLPNEVYRTYRYHADTKKMTIQIHYKPAVVAVPDGPEYSLASNVSGVTFGPPVTVTGSNNTTVTVRVPVTVVVKVGSNEVRLSGSSGPRRAAQD